MQKINNKITPELYKAIVAIVDERMKEFHIPREDFHELKGIVKRLAQAQARTEEAVERLAQAQARTEERVGRLEEAVERLAQAQARTEERVGRLEEAVERLAQAQARTEEAVERLAQAQARTERAVGNMAKEIGGLSATIGFGLEDICRVVLPGYLERHYNVYVSELNRKFFRVNKTDVEINFYGEGRKNGKKVVILGEAKSRIYEGEVKKFLQQISKVTPQIEHEILKVMFGYLIHPTAVELAKKEGVILVASYQR